MREKMRGAGEEGGRPYYEAEGEPRVTLDNMTGIVAAVVALADYALITFDLFTEGVLAARENKTHGELLRDV